MAELMDGGCAARTEGVCGPATVIRPWVEDPNNLSDGGGEERDVERSVSSRVYHPRRYSLHVLRRRRGVRRWRGAADSACGQERVDFGRAATHARAWWCGDGPFTRSCGHSGQDRRCALNFCGPAGVNEQRHRQPPSHEQTTVRKPDHCAAGAGSTGQSKQRAGRVRGGRAAAGRRGAQSRRPPRRSRCAYGCRQRAPYVLRR